MQKWRQLLVLASVLICSVIPSAQTLAAFDPALAFDKKCSSCHTIGAGVLKGPDLKDVTKRRTEDWLVPFIQSSATVIENGDPDAVKLYNEFGQKDMPDQRLSREEILQILKYIESGGVAPAAGGNARSVTTATPDDIQMGQKIYLGQIPLKNGGPACISCHSVGDQGPFGGGTLARNLTHTYANYNDQGMSVALQKLAFPVMDEVFATKPLTEDEVFQIKAFLYNADRTYVGAPNSSKKFLFLGLAGAVVLLGVLDFAWRARRKNSVRKNRGGLR